MAGRFTVEAVFKATDRFSGALGTFQAKLGKFATGAKAQLGKIDKLGASVASGMKTAAFGLGTAAVGTGAVLTAAAMPGLDFGEAIASVGAVSLMTRDQIADLEAKARELGLTTKFSATEVAKGMEVMGRAGFTNAQVIAGIGPMLSAAAAEGAEFEPVAEVISSVIKGMGLEMSETKRVADVLTLASAKTKSSILSLGESLATAGPMAKQFNIPLEQVTASVALLQDVGLDASVAGSAVGTMLNNLANPSKEARGEMKALGISFEDAHGNMLPLTDVFQQFVKGSQKAGGNMKQVAFFADLLGLRGQKAGQNLRDAFAKGDFQKLVEDLKHAEGSAEKMASIRLDQAKGDLKILQNNVLDLGISLYDIGSNKLREIVQSTTEWVQANRDVVQSVAKDIFVDIVAGAKRARFYFDLFTDGVRSGFDTLSTFVRPLRWVSGIFGDGKWTSNVNLLGQAVGGLLPLFYGLVVVSKLAQASLIAFRVATALVTAAVWLARTAQTAWIAGQITWMRVTMASTATAGEAKVAQSGLAAATNAGAAASNGAAAGTTSATGALKGMIGPAAAATAALLSLYAAWHQLEGLKNASGGWGGLWAGVKGLFNAKGFTKSVDNYQDQQARNDFAREHNLDLTGQSVEDYIAAHKNDVPAPAADGYTPAGDIPGINAPGTPTGSDAGGAPAAAPSLPPSAQAPEADAAQQAQQAELLAMMSKYFAKDQNSVIELRVPQGVQAEVKTPKAGVRNPVKVTQSGGPRG